MKSSRKKTYGVSIERMLSRKEGVEDYQDSMLPSRAATAEYSKVRSERMFIRGKKRHIRSSQGDNV